MRHAIPAALLLMANLALQGCVVSPAQKTAEPIVPQQARITGYLARDAVPNSAVLSPAPPAAGSAAQALDEEMNRKYLALADTPRLKVAAMDAVLEFPDAAQTFSCALQAPVTKEATPTLYKLLQKTLADGAGATTGAKNLYKRPRPYTVNGRPSCTPASEEVMRANSSYPSGHASVGWTWALVLAEISPDQASAIFARGRAFAESRLVCNVHWYSDTVEGITMASATVARLHAEPLFVGDMAVAREELQAIRAKNLPVPRDCAAEAAALKP